MVADKLRERLLAMSDEKYQKFHQRLCPATENIIGVRLPLLRQLAKEIIREADWQNYLQTAQPQFCYYEEIMLQGLVIGYLRADIAQVLAYTDAFVPKIDNWAVCDTFCSGLKITQKHRPLVWDYLQPYFSSTREFALRFAVVMLLSFYLQPEYINDVFRLLAGIRHEGYYVKMAVAWTLSVCYVKFPTQTQLYLQTSTLDDFTYNKTLQKIIESRRISLATKESVRAMKRGKVCLREK